MNSQPDDRDAEEEHGHQPDDRRRHRDDDENVMIADRQPERDVGGGPEQPAGPAPRSRGDSP